MRKEKLLGIISIPLVFMPILIHSILETIIKTESWWAFYLFYAVSCFISILIVIIILRIGKISFKDIGFKNFKLSHIWWSILFFFIAGIIWNGFSYLFTIIGTPDNSSWGLDIKYSNFAQIILIIIYAAIAAPLTEEILFRGLLITNLGKITKPWIAGIVSVVLFGIYHLGFGWKTGVIFLFWAALPTILFIWKKSIYPGLIMHVINNIFAFVVLSFLNQ